MDDIPVKLRCAACNKLANNAFRLPCCDQSICEDCKDSIATELYIVMLTPRPGQASLPVACPVCLHEPMVPDDCRPNKALRTTIKVFLKKKVMERETARKKEAMEKAIPTPATPATPLPDQTPAPKFSETPAPPLVSAIVDSGDAKQASRDVSQPTEAQGNPGLKTEEPTIPTEAQKDIPQDSIEVISLTDKKHALLTLDSLLALRSQDGHLRKRLVMVVLVKKRQMLTTNKWSSSNRLWNKMSRGLRTVCRG